MKQSTETSRLNGGPPPLEEQSDDVRGFGPDDITGSLVPSLPTPPPPPPGPGTFITGWPDPVPAVCDPATLAAWKGPKVEPPNR